MHTATQTTAIHFHHRSRQSHVKRALSSPELGPCRLIDAAGICSAQPGWKRHDCTQPRQPPALPPAIPGSRNCAPATRCGALNRSAPSYRLKKSMVYNRRLHVLLSEMDIWTCLSSMAWAASTVLHHAGLTRCTRIVSDMAASLTTAGPTVLQRSSAGETPPGSPGRKTAAGQPTSRAAATTNAEALAVPVLECRNCF